MTASESTSKPFTITLFGPMRVQVDGNPLPHLRSRKALWLLALLVLRIGRPVEREWLAGTLWPDVDQGRASMNLRVVLSELRHALGSAGGRLQSPSRHTLSLNFDGADVDLLAFDVATTSQEREALTQAVSLYQGPLLAGCTEEWIGQERAAREQACLRALEALADDALANGDWTLAAGYFRRAVGISLWRETAQRGLMEALSKGGDTSAALEAYQTFVRLLRKDDPRALPDEKTASLYARLRTEARRASTPPAVATEGDFAPTVTGYLPHPLTDMVGRDDERMEVTERVRRSRLVTLTGPGGVGKTRLAIEVAFKAAMEYADGVWLVSLEALSDGAQVVGQIALVIGAREESDQTPLEGVAAHLKAKRLLLVLDNCEHLLEASAQVAAYLLRECAGVRLLATSRAALGITGEAAWVVPGLSVPDPAHLPTGRATLVRVLAGYEGVQLFVERAQSVQKTFALNGDNASAVAMICAGLHGIPFAIELAAARTRALTVEQIAARLDDRLDLLKDVGRTRLPRQQTLRGTLDWSYDLLGEPERLLLQRLSVFAGGWALEAAEQVCAGDSVEAGQVLNLLTSLVDKSLAVFEVREKEAESRYRLLETVRQYAAERLEASGTTDQTRSRHREWFADLAVQAGAGLRGAEQISWLRRLETERENLRAALIGIGADAVGVKTSLRMAGAMWWFWYIRGYLSEGRQMLDTVLQREEAQEPTASRGTALIGAGTLSAVLGELDTARALYEESLLIFRTLGDRDSAATALGNLGNIAMMQGEYETARERCAESLAVFREGGKQQRIAASLGNLAQVALIQGDFASAEAMNTEALAIFKALQDKQGSARTLNGLADVAYHQGDFVKAREFYEGALTLFRELQEPRGICDAVSGLGDLELERGDYPNARALYRESLILRRETGLKDGVEFSIREFASLTLRCGEPRKAVRLWSSAEALRQAVGSRLLPLTQHLVERRLTEARMALGEPEFAKAQAEGRAMTWEEAAVYALEETEGRAKASSGSETEP